MSFNYESLVFDLPEDINRAKISGDFGLTLSLIDARLNDRRTSPIMRERLETEKLTLHRWLKRYVYDRSQALEICRKRIRGFKDEELDAAEKLGMVDYIWIKGEKRYLSSFCGTMIKSLPGYAERCLDKKDEKDDGTAFKPFFEEIQKTGRVGYRYRLKSSLKIDEGSFKAGGTYLAHMPIPAKSAQQRAEDISVIADVDAHISAVDAPLRTVSYNRKLYENVPFEAEFSFTSVINYVRPFEDAPRIVYPLETPPTEDDLSEQYPNIVFTPYLKQLAKYIAGDETRPLNKAKLVYDYITKNVTYSFMRPYVLIDRQAE